MRCEIWGSDYCSLCPQVIQIGWASTGHIGGNRLSAPTNAIWYLWLRCPAILFPDWDIAFPPLQ
jgi:hypothetical protein